jgi:hypothetical protein
MSYAAPPPPAGWSHPAPPPPLPPAKKNHIGLIIILIILGALVFVCVGVFTACASAAPDDGNSFATTNPTDETTPSTTTTSTTKTTKTTQAISAEERNAIESARGYLGNQAFSRRGLIGQLSSKYGESYPVDVATRAVDSLHVDWNQQAYRSAKSYLDTGPFSRAGLIEQLESKSGEGFTHSQAVYGATRALK